jgi:hypothetical protein
MMNIREYYLSLWHLIQADLARVDRVGNCYCVLAFEVVIPEVSDRESRSYTIDPRLSNYEDDDR